jgi:hypothetical protein
MTKLKALTNFKFIETRTPEQKFVELGPLAQRHGQFPKGTVLPATQTPACPRVKVSDFPAGFIPTKYFDALEQNQLIRSCCRHPENHEVEAMKSHPDEVAPDIYVFHCTCGRKHRRFCIGKFDENRPYWEVA